MVYLDYNATTPLAPEVVEEITKTLTEAWGNPSSSYTAGVKAKTAISTARKHVADMIGAKPHDIIFTSGGTEGNNWILQSAIAVFRDSSRHSSQEPGNVFMHRPHFISSNIEHDSVKLVLEHFEDEGLADVSFIPVRTDTGSIHPDDVVTAIRSNTVMISIMMANNETGVIQPISEICERVKSLKRRGGETKKIYLHTDAAQAIGKIPVDVTDLGIDFLTIVGHKFYGPRIGAIFTLNPGIDTPLPAMLYGGGQERNFRPGTENTPMIAGLGKASELVVRNLNCYQTKMTETRDYLESRLVDCFGKSVLFNGKYDISHRLPNTCNVSFVGENLKGYEILAKAPSVHASVGAACHSQDRPSHILLAIGVSKSDASKALRISVGRETTKEDIDGALKELQMVFNS